VNDNERRGYVDIPQYGTLSRWPELRVSNEDTVLGYVMHFLQREQCLMCGDVTTYSSTRPGAASAQILACQWGRLETTMHSMQNSSAFNRFSLTRFSIIYSWVNIRQLFVKTLFGENCLVPASKHLSSASCIFPGRRTLPRPAQEREEREKMEMQRD
jgi:hypothetical protein